MSPAHCSGVKQTVADTSDNRNTKRITIKKYTSRDDDENNDDFGTKCQNSYNFDGFYDSLSLCVSYGRNDVKTRNMRKKLRCYFFYFIFIAFLYFTFAA